MAEIKGYLLTAEEEEACADLVKKLRKRKVFTINFSGRIQVKVRTREEANEIFWNWVEDVENLQNTSLGDWCRFITQPPIFEGECDEEE